MKINRLFVFLLLCFSAVNAQHKDPWKRIDPSSVQITAKALGNFESADAILFQLEEEVLKTRLKNIHDKKQTEIDNCLLYTSDAADEEEV